MSAYDVLTAEATCPWCGHLQTWRIQYKYGFCRLHENAIDGLILWSDSPNWRRHQRDYGRNVGGVVKVSAGAENRCVGCGRGNVYATITVENNRIRGVELSQAEPALGPDGYVQVDPSREIDR